MIDIDALIRRQAGVITRRQCLEVGLSDDVVRTRIEHGAWLRADRGVLVVLGERRGYQTRAVAAAFGVGGEVALGRESALWWADRDRPVPKLVHLAVPRGRSVRPRSGVLVHHDLRPTTRITMRDPAVVSVEDAVLDIAGAACTAREVEAVVCEMVRRHRTIPARLGAVLRERPRHPRRALLTAMFTEVEQGAQSPLELMDLRIDRRHGRPGSRQVLQRVDGHGRWLDVVLNPPGVRRPIVKELDGRLGHEDPHSRFRDMDRDNDAALRRRVAVRFGWHDLADRPCRTASATAAVLLGEGWTGIPRGCGQTCTLPGELPQLLALGGT